MLTSILPPTGFVPKTEVDQGESRPKVKFKTPFTLDTVFGADPDLDDLMLFAQSRGVNFKSLSKDEKVLWTTSWRENRVFCGYLVMAVVFPAFLKRRIKLRDAETHWVNLDGGTPKGRSRLESRGACMDMVKSMTASSCFRGTSDIIHPEVLVRDFIGLPANDEGVLFFTQRDFPRNSKNSSAHASCSAILSHLWFVTTVLGRPCCLDSVVVPILGEEMSRLEYLQISGKVSAFPVDWKSDVFPKLPGYSHVKVAGLFLERLTSDSYVDVYPCDAFLLYKSKLNSRGSDVKTISPGAKCSAHNLAVVPCFDTLLSKSTTCDLDALDISSIAMEFGEKAAFEVKSTEAVGLFSAAMGRKMKEAINYFSENHALVRRFVNNRAKVVQCQDPGGIRKKLSTGRILDPRIGKNVEAVKDMIGQISLRTWGPMKGLMLKLVDGMTPDMDEESLCKVFLGVGEESGIQTKAKNHGVSMVDVSNVCFLLCLTMSFQRSQVLRDSTVREYVTTREGSGYTLSLNREIKTTGADSNGFSPVREFDLTPSQSMMVHFIKIVGNRRGSQRLLVNERGGDMTQSNLGFRYRAIGKSFLGISNLSPHAMRTFFASFAIDSGAVDGKDLNEFAAYLQVSAKQLSTSYVASSTRTESHRIGKRVLGDIMDAGSRKMSKPKEFNTESRPKGRQLAKARDIHRKDILNSVARYKNANECFKTLVEHRREGCMQKKDEWFKFENSYFSDGDTKFFVRFVQSRIA